MNADPPGNRPFWLIPAEFVLHAIVGTFTFAIIVIPAVGLDLLVKSLARYNMEIIVIWGVKFAEYSLFTADLLLFAVFLIKTCWRSAKRI